VTLCSKFYVTLQTMGMKSTAALSTVRKPETQSLSADALATLTSCSNCRVTGWGGQHLQGCRDCKGRRSRCKRWKALVHESPRYKAKSMGSVARTQGKGRHATIPAHVQCRSDTFHHVQCGPGRTEIPPCLTSTPASHCRQDQEAHTQRLAHISLDQQFPNCVLRKSRATGHQMLYKNKGWCSNKFGNC
jgi:hypothetical protein